MAIIISILGIILTIFFIVGIHEFGHFIVARMLGIKVLRFSIGFGKPFYRWYDKKGTEYVLAPIPLGGYVKMLDETEDQVPKEELHLAYNRQPIYKRTLVILAGPFFNFMLALIIYWFIFLIGFTSIIPLIGKVLPGSIAANAGLKPQNEIISIDNRPTKNWSNVLIRLIPFIGDHDTLVVETKPLHGNTATKHTLNLQTWKIDELKPDPLTSLGIEPYIPSTPIPKYLIRTIQYGPMTALSHANQNTIDFIYLNFLFMGKIITGKVSLQSLGGPISIFQGAGTALNTGILPFFSFLAFLSIAIGVINVLPIPGLDGGHLLFYCIEFITRRPVSPALQLLLIRFGLILLMLLLAQAVSNDLMRL